MLEKYYTIGEIAEMLRLSFERTRQLIMGEPGVLRFEAQTNSKRHRRTYRIPESVLQRILRRSLIPPAA